MSRPINPRAPLLVSCASALLLAIPLAAQIPIGGAQTGTLPAGVYHTTSTLVVASSTTWTLSAGVIIKFTSNGHRIDVNGTLNANGTSLNPVILTDDGDDSAGGDTNGNGASTGSAAQWEGVVFNAGSGGSLTFASIRYGGSAFVSNVELNSANPTLTSCTIRNCFTDGLDLNTNSNPVVSGCTFTNNAGYAIQRAAIGAVPGITNNTASGNGINSIHVTSGTLASNLAIGPASNLTGGILVGTTITIPATRTLTLNAGAILKFDTNGTRVSTDGTLVVNGAAGNPVIFTDDGDDSAGGDTNTNGASNGGAAQWEGLVFNFGSSASSLNYADIRYGGSAFVSNVELLSSSPTLTNCTIRNCFTDALDLNGTASPNGLSLPTVTNCTFTNNAGYAIQRAHLRAVPGITNNAASGNGLNSIHVTDATLATNVTIGPASNLGGAILIGTTIVVPQGLTLALNAGAILKLDNAGVEVTVNGTLQSNGASGNPVIFTDDGDDAAGGDTNNNGASNGSPTAWRGIVFNPTSSACTMTWSEIRYGGSAFVSNIELNSASPTFTNCTIHDCHTDGMDLNANSNPIVSNCTFTDSGGYAVQRVHVGAVAGFTNNVATGNGLNSLHVTSGTMSASTTITAASNLSGAILVGSDVVVPPGITLALGAGVVLKIDSTWEIVVGGTLQANGSLASPVIITDDGDDSAGGDTNNNGPSGGSATAWRGIVFNAGSNASSLTYADIRYGGSSFVSNVELNSASPTFTNCTIRNCHTDGMDLNANSSPTVAGCAFSNNGGRAVGNAQLTAIPGFTNNTASGNAGGNYIRVTDGNVASALTIGAQSILNGALVAAANVSVAAAGALNVGQGVVIKFDGQLDVIVNGAMNLKGTSYEPVVFTSMSDDSWGGDTNVNGPSAGASANWRGVTFNAGALSSGLENVLIRYTGGSFIPALTSASPNVSLRAVRVDDAYDRGFVLSALASNPVNLIAWSCNGHGIHLTGGGFTVVHATSTANGVGMRAEPGWTGSVINSISWGNGTNFQNFGAGAQVSYSDGGFSGSNNNVNVDPLFVSLPTGDLHLTATSPCLNVGDLFTAFGVLKDHDENSRILDSALSGTPGADLGAYELGNWDMDVFGVPRINTQLTFVVNGPAGDSVYVLGILDGVLPIPPWGILLAGAIPDVSVIQLVPYDVPVGTALNVFVPNDPAIIGLTAGIQTLTRPTGSLALGNFTQLYRASVRP